jgi:hypothetical protein
LRPGIGLLGREVQPHQPQAASRPTTPVAIATQLVDGEKLLMILRPFESESMPRPLTNIPSSGAHASDASDPPREPVGPGEGSRFPLA